MTPAPNSEPTPQPPTPRVGLMHRHAMWRMEGSIALGLGAGLFVPVPHGSQVISFRILVGFAIGAGFFSLTALLHLLRVDADNTKSHVAGLGGDRTTVDLVVFAGSFGALAAIAFMLFGGGAHKTAQDTGLEAAVTIAAVAAAWLSIHTAYTMRYAKHYYNVEPGCIDFNTTEPPQFSDFAYLAFDLGMTYQVSDTNVHTKALRKMILAHTMLSYVFGTCIIASALNVVIGLASN